MLCTSRIKNNILGNRFSRGGLKKVPKWGHTPE